jgi:hypothetical protein
MGRDMRFKDLGVDERIILTLISKKWDGVHGLESSASG